MIPAISAIPSLPPPTPPSSSNATGDFSSAIASASDPLIDPTDAGAPSGGTSAVGNVLDALQSAQQQASSAEALSAAGQGNLADTMIAATQASLATEVTTSLLSQATTAYNSIMNMSL